MEHSGLREIARLERQMKAARQLRAETMARGLAFALEGLSSVVRRMLDRFRGAQGLPSPSWRD